VVPAVVAPTGPSFRDTPTEAPAARPTFGVRSGSGGGVGSGWGQEGAGWEADEVGGSKKGKKGKKKGTGGFGFEDDDEGKGTLIKVGSREEFESIVGAVHGVGAGGGQNYETYAYKRDKQEQSSVAEVLTAAEQYALRFL